MIGTSFVVSTPFTGSDSWICSVAAPGTSVPVPTAEVLLAKKRLVNVQLPTGTTPAPLPQSTLSEPGNAWRFAEP